MDEGISKLMPPMKAYSRGESSPEIRIKKNFDEPLPKELVASFAGKSEKCVCSSLAERLANKAIGDLDEAHRTDIAQFQRGYS